MNTPFKTDESAILKQPGSVLHTYSYLSSKRRLWQLFIMSAIITVIINIFDPAPTLLVLYAIPVILATLIFMNLWIVMLINLIFIVICVILIPGPPVWEAIIIPFIGYVFISYIIKQLVLISKRNIEQRTELEQLFDDTIHVYSQTLDARDAYTAFHSKNVAVYAKQIAEAMQLPSEEVNKVYIAGILHDTGKIGTPESILCKEGKLTDEEFTVMKDHPVHGYNILKPVHYLQELGITDMVLHHHEKVDGSGYPNGLKEDQIPIGARILAVSDAFDAMTTDRSYRTKLTSEEAIEELEKNKGTQFDPKVLEAFLSLKSIQTNINKEMRNEHALYQCENYQRSYPGAKRTDHSGGHKVNV